MPSSPTTNPPAKPLTAEEMNSRYQDGLTELTEQKKLGLLTQDTFDNLHQDLIEKVFGKPKEE